MSILAELYQYHTHYVNDHSALMLIDAEYRAYIASPSNGITPAAASEAVASTAVLTDSSNQSSTPSAGNLFNIPSHPLVCNSRVVPISTMSNSTSHSYERTDGISTTTDMNVSSNVKPSKVRLYLPCGHLPQCNLSGLKCVEPHLIQEDDNNITCTATDNNGLRRHVLGGLHLGTHQRCEWTTCPVFEEDTCSCYSN